MTVSQKGIDLIKSFEGCQLEAYPDPGQPSGLPVTIGWGSTLYQTGEKIKLGDTITQEQADTLLAWEVNNKAKVINAMDLELTQNQFDAIVCFAYNVGLGAFNSSTMLKRIKAGDYAVANEFGKWCKAGGKVMNGLVRRRAAEAALYNS